LGESQSLLKTSLNNVNINNIIQVNMTDIAKQSVIIDSTLTFNKKLNKLGDAINEYTMHS